LFEEQRRLKRETDKEVISNQIRDLDDETSSFLKIFKRKDSIVVAKVTSMYLNRISDVISLFRDIPKS